MFLTPCPGDAAAFDAAQLRLRRWWRGALAALRARAPQAALERAWASLAPAHVARLARVIADAEASASATLAAGATPQSVLQPMWGAEMGVEARYVPHSSSDLSFISRSGSDLNHF